MVDAADLKSASRKGVWVRVPPSAVRSPPKSQGTAVGIWAVGFPLSFELRHWDFVVENPLKSTLRVRDSPNFGD
jgi:hypothetical protein